MGLFSSLFSSNHSDALSAEQIEAAIAALYLTTMIDGEVNEQEVGAVGDAMDETPWCTGLDDKQLEELYRRGFERAKAITEADSEERASNELQSLGRSLGTDEVRRQVLRMATLVALGDGDVHPDELGGIGAMGLAFGFPEDEVQAIVDQAGTAN